MVLLWLILFFIMVTDTPGGNSSDKDAPAGYASTSVEVKFREGTDASAPEHCCPQNLELQSLV